MTASAGNPEATTVTSFGTFCHSSLFGSCCKSPDQRANTHESLGPLISSKAWKHFGPRDVESRVTTRSVSFVFTLFVSFGRTQIRQRDLVATAGTLWQEFGTRPPQQVGVCLQIASMSIPNVANNQLPSRSAMPCFAHVGSASSMTCVWHSTAYSPVNERAQQTTLQTF